MASTWPELHAGTNFNHVWDVDTLAWVKEQQGVVEITGTVGAVVSTKTPLTGSSPTAATVGVSSAQAVASNSSRKGLTLVNTSAARISIAFGATAVLDSGITLYPNGGVFMMGEYDYSTAAVNAIASAASSNLAVQEWT